MKRADVREAEDCALRQRIAGAAYLVVDESKAQGDDAKAQCGRIKTLAKDQPAQFEAILRNRAVVDLFCWGALSFKPPATEAAP